MNSFSRYVKPLLYFAFGCGIVFWMVFHPNTPQAWLGFVGHVSLAASVLLFIYETVGWRINPFERIPRLKHQYTGTISYEWNGIAETKQIEVSIEQQRSSVSVTTQTNESTSRSLASAIVKEEGSYSVYYVYRTTPLAEVEGRNPIQLGTCRIVIPKQSFAWSRAWVLPKAPDQLMAKYWTSRKTCGDIRLQAVKTEKHSLDPASPVRDNVKP